MTTRATLRLWLLVALLLSVTLGLHQLGQRGLMRIGLADGASLAGQTWVFRDPEGRLGVEAVAQEQAEGNFRRAPPSDLVFGYTRDAIWLTTVVANPGREPLVRYLEVGPPRLEDVRIYLPAPGGGYRELRSGIHVPVLQRVIPSRQLVVPLEVAPGTSVRVYVRLASRNSMLVELRLWEPTRFLEAARRMDLLNGLQFGALLLFAVYGFASAGAMRERSYFYFGITLLCYAAYDIAILQYGYQYLWPGAPDWSLRSPGLVLAVSVAAMGMLVSSLLQARLQFPRWGRTLRALSVAGLVLIVPLWLADYRVWVQVLNYVALLQLLATIGATLQAVFAGTRGAALLLASFLLLWFTSLLRVGQILGWLPPNILAEYSQGWSMVLGGMFMAMTQADRVRRLATERELARRELVSAQVTAREEAERAVAARTRELVQARDAAEASNRAKSAFLAQLSHELRTPLHSILGYSGLLRTDARDAESQRRLDAIRRSGVHLLNLIDGLLDYARGEAGRLQLELQPVRLRPFLESVAEENRPLAAQEGMVLDTAFAASLPEALRLDGTRLRQVLINLVANACRHSQGRRILLSAEGLPAVRDGLARIRITVADDGIGIPVGDRERIFQPFEQGSGTDAGRGMGMGLGLAITRQLVALMGGEVELEAGAPGSRFMLTLDAEPLDLPALPGPVRVAAERRYGGPPRRVLVVDDDGDSREVLAQELVRMGFAVRVASSAEQALDCLDGEGADLVLTDQRMPGMDGSALLQAARARGHRQPFVLMSALAADGTREVAEGFAATLAKPLDVERLATAISRCLGLAWQQLPGPPSETVRSPRPSAALVEELREAAVQGRISDIDDWVEHVTETEPAAADFAQEVRKAARRLDLAAIVDMTR